MSLNVTLQHEQYNYTPTYAHTTLFVNRYGQGQTIIYYQQSRTFEGASNVSLCPLFYQQTCLITAL
jgi:hypothetical protein